MCVRPFESYAILVFLGSEVAEATIQVDYKEVDARGCGPRTALKRVLAEAPEGVAKQRWAEESRVRAILGSCPRM